MAEDLSRSVSMVIGLQAFNITSLSKSIRSAFIILPLFHSKHPDPPALARGSRSDGKGAEAVGGVRVEAHTLD